MYSALLWSLPLLYGGGGKELPGSYLHRNRPGADGLPVVEAYVAQEGDLVFFDKPSKLWDTLDAIAGTGPPDHIGIMVRRPDGTIGLMEAGPDMQPRVFIQDWLPRLQRYQGRIWIRRVRCGLTPEQSAALTDFALRQEGKRYALFRLARQITPFRPHGPIRKKLFGHTFHDRRRWFCSELVLSAGAEAGLFDPQRMPANAIYPREILHDGKFNLSAVFEEAARWYPCAPELSARENAPDD